MERNYLKGFIGDEMNLLMAASAFFNCKKWMNAFIQALFAVQIALMVYELGSVRVKG